MTIFSMRPERHMDRMVQHELRMLGFPMADAWPGRENEPEAPLDGSSLKLALGAPAERNALIALIRSAAESHSDGYRGRAHFVLLATTEEYSRMRGKPLGQAVTLWSVGGDIIRYQPVLVEASFARVQLAVPDGIVLAADADRVHAWSGIPIGAAPIKG